MTLDVGRQVIVIHITIFLLSDLIMLGFNLKSEYINQISSTL